MPTWQRNLAALFVAQLAAMIGFSFVLPFIPLYVQELGVSDPTAAAQWAGAIAAAAALAMAVTQPFWGSLADRHGRRPMVLRAMVAAALTLAGMGLAHGPGQLLVLRLLQGALTGTLAASNALVATSVPRQRLGMALGLIQVALFGGTAIGPLIGGVLADHVGHRGACFAAGALALLATAIVALMVREDFHPPPATGARGPRQLLTEQRAVLALLGVPALIALVFALQLSNTIVAPILPLYIKGLSGDPRAATTAGLIFAGTGAASLLSAVVLGRAGDQLGHRRVLLVCLLGCAACYLPQAVVVATWQLAALRVGLGLFVGGLMPSANALLAAAIPADRRGAGFGLAAASSSLANAIGPLGGALVATALEMRAVFAITGLLYLAGPLLLLSLRRPARPGSTAATKGLRGQVAGASRSEELEPDGVAQVDRQHAPAKAVVVPGQKR